MLFLFRGELKHRLCHVDVGEIIDEETKKNRREAWAKDHPNDPNFIFPENTQIKNWILYMNLLYGYVFKWLGVTRLNYFLYLLQE